MLKVAYIAESEREVKPAKAKAKRERSDFGEQMSYKFFKKACEAYADRIAAIQESIPGWEPEFKLNK